MRGKTGTWLTLLRPATGALRAEPVDHRTNAIFHPWLTRELAAILKDCPPAPPVIPEGRRWQAGDPFPAAEHLEQMSPPWRLLLIVDHLAGHSSRDFVRGCESTRDWPRVDPLCRRLAH